MVAGRLALVTGASSGIGRATARLLASKGCNVALSGRDEQALVDLVKEIRTKVGDEVDVEYFVGDVTDDEDVKRIVESTVNMSSNGKLDMLVLSAGVLQGGAVGAATMDNFDFNMNSNARSVFSCITAAVPFLERSKDQPTASIVNVSSVNGLRSFGGCAAYCASKAAVDMITDCAAVDLAPKNIRVNSVNPGVTRSELQKRGGLSEEQYAGFLERSATVTHPLGRIAEAEEVASAILFLADSSQSDFITGTHMTVDGGRSCLGAR
mmetsp:Transcript_4425/g.7795  ORF Transcript_4425/g.7795 Transcript_4425/m.7795 type:complete len:266 (+) Transcript_4425:61-858(+)